MYINNYCCLAGWMRFSFRLTILCYAARMPPESVMQKEVMLADF
jgi:hypothetical protein